MKIQGNTDGASRLQPGTSAGFAQVFEQYVPAEGVANGENRAGLALFMQGLQEMSDITGLSCVIPPRQWVPVITTVTEMQYARSPLPLEGRLHHHTGVGRLSGSLKPVQNNEQRCTAGKLIAGTNPVNGG